MYREINDIEQRAEYENLLFEWQIERENATQKEGHILLNTRISFESLKELLDGIAHGQ